MASGNISTIAGCALVVLLALSVKYSHACAAPTPSSGSGDRVIVTAIATMPAAYTAGTAATDLTTALDKLKVYAAGKGHTLLTSMPVSKTAVQVGTKFGIRLEIMGAFDKCIRILEFFQLAASSATETMNSGIESATVQCGNFDVVEIA